MLYAPGDMHDYETSAGAGHWELSWVHFRPRTTWNKFLKWPVHANGLRYLALTGNEVQADFAAAFHAMLELQRRTLPVADDLAMAALEQALIWSYAAAGSDASHFDARVRRAADYLASHLQVPFQLETLAGQCNLSVSRLSHLFKAQLGVSPQQFLEQQRIRHACDLLRLTGMSIAEVAREVGYDDPFYFSNRFRRNLGMSPMSYRKSADKET